MVRIGQPVPDFEVDAFQKGEVKKIKLSNYRGKWVVMIFYPADFTFICPTELAEAASMYNEFKKNDAEILSVSTDLAEQQLERVTGQRYSQVINEGPTSFTGNFSNYSYQISVSAVPAALATDPGMVQYKQVQVSVSHVSAGTVNLRTVVTNH